MNESLESNRKLLLSQQTTLRQMMQSDHFDAAMDLFFRQHAMLHSAQISQDPIWSFADAILDNMPVEHIRRIPHHCDHSIAWCFWHMARVEDITMNVLVAGSSQVIYQDNWLDHLGSPFQDTGNALNETDMIQFSAQVDIEALRAYRLSVGRRTREIVRQLAPTDLETKVAPIRIQRIVSERAVNQEAQGIIAYWSKRNIAGLLLMPATRHNLVHLNEALRLKGKKI